MRSRDAEKEMAAANPVEREQADSLPLSPAEDELLDALLAEPLPARSATRSAAWARGRGARRLALGGAGLTAAVAAALLVSAGGDNPSAAFAVEPQEGGGVKIEIYDLADPEGVEEALAAAGIRSQVNYLEAGMTCREPHYQPSMALFRTLQEGQPQPQPWAGFDFESISGPLTIAIGDYQQRREMCENFRQSVAQGDHSGAEPSPWPSLVIDPTGFRPDQTLIMTSAPTPEGYEQPAPDSPGVMQAVSDVQIDTVGQVRVAEGEVGSCEPVPASPGPNPVRAPEGGWDFSQTPYAGWGFGPGIGKGAE